MSILITGGAGNIGSSLANRLSKSGYQVLVIDNLSTGDIKKLNMKEGNIEFVKADVNDNNQLMPIMLSRKIDFVYHFAATVGVARTLDYPMLVFDDIDGIRNILNLSKNIGVKRFFFSSSSEVYGEPVSLPQFEDKTPLNSKLPYAIVKNLGESMIKSYSQEFDLDFTIYRFFNTYGPNQSTDFVVSKFIEKAMNNLDITIYGDGLQTRTFCYIDDNNEVLQNIQESGSFRNDIMNVGSDIEMTIVQLANEVIRITSSKSKVIHLPRLEEGDMTRRCPDTTKMKIVLDRDLVSLEEGIKKTIQLKNF